MSVYCEHCEDDNCLELTDGELDVTPDGVAEARLEYRCTEHGLEGTYRGAGRAHSVTGALVLVETRGTPIDDYAGGVEQ